MVPRITASILALWAVSGPGLAQDLTALDGPGIRAALTDRFVTYDTGATQRFFASGRTLYTHGEPSWGSWRVENDQYCSLWPPSPTWDCYDVAGDGAGAIVFSDAYGNSFPGVIAPE